MFELYKMNLNNLSNLGKLLKFCTSVHTSRRSLTDDGIVEIRPPIFDFSQILIVMLNWLILR